MTLSELMLEQEIEARNRLLASDAVAMRGRTAVRGAGVRAAAAATLARLATRLDRSATERVVRSALPAPQLEVRHAL